MLWRSAFRQYHGERLGQTAQQRRRSEPHCSAAAYGESDRGSFLRRFVSWCSRNRTSLETVVSLTLNFALVVVKAGLLLVGRRPRKRNHLRQRQESPQRTIVGKCDSLRISRYLSTAKTSRGINRIPSVETIDAVFLWSRRITGMRELMKIDFSSALDVAQIVSFFNSVPKVARDWIAGWMIAFSVQRRHMGWAELQTPPCQRK